MKPLRILTLLALSLVPLTGCGGGSSGPRVAFVSNNPASFWAIAEKGCRDAEKEFGVEVLFRKPDQGDPARQQEILDTLRNQRVKAVAVSVIDPSGQLKYLNEYAATIPLLAVDNDAPSSKRACYVGTNNYEAGRAVGQLVREILPEGGTIALFVGDDKPLNARQRCLGVMDELARAQAPGDVNDIEAPKPGMFGPYRLIGVYTDQPDGETKALQNARSVLSQNRDEKGVCFVGLWAYNPPTILTAVEDAVKAGDIQPGQIRIVGFDEDARTLKGIAEGKIHGTVVQDPYKFGYESVRIMAGIARGDMSVVPAGKAMHIPHRVITRDGGEGRIKVAEFKEQLDRLLGN